VALGVRLKAWSALAALLAAGSLLAWFAPAASIDWQPGLAACEPWRWWSAAFVHWSPLHLGANLLGAALVGALGWAGDLPRRAALAWFIAWPLTQLGLLLQPDLLHFGGLSGVLHAGVAVAAVSLLLDGRGRQRTIASGLLAGLAIKLILEAPWGPPLRHPNDWDIAVAPLAHSTGAIFGGLSALGLRRRQSQA
jgi:rhomboid family GlyGly-CTERM serine protease